MTCPAATTPGLVYWSRSSTVLHPFERRGVAVTSLDVARVAENSQ
jgi:hypothetical protein